MLEFDAKSNLLEQANYKYRLQDVEEPNLYRELYEYSSVPKIAFNHRVVPLHMPGRPAELLPLYGRPDRDAL